MEPQTPQAKPTEAEVAAVIVLILAGQAPEQVAAAGGVGAAIALALLAFVPESLPWPLRASVSAEAAALVLRDRPELPGGSGAILAARRSNLVYRALYGINATRRIVGKAVGGEGSVEERLRAAVEAEASYFAAHKKANARRLASAGLTEAASSVYGEVLGWTGVLDSKTTPDCRRLIGKNYRAASPPDGLHPGARHPYCRCSPGAPFPNAQTV